MGVRRGWLDSFQRGLGNLEEIVVLYLKFSDLKKRGIVSNWQTLRRWIDREGFPPGIMLGPNSRAWLADLVYQWLDSRPQGGKKRGGESNSRPWTADSISEWLAGRPQAGKSGGE